MNLYQLASNLHVPVYELRARMSASEFMGWMQFYRQRDEEDQRSKGKPNLLENPDAMLRGFGL